MTGTTGDEGQRAGGRRRRTTPERVTFAVSLVLLGALLGGIARDLAKDEQPADPVATLVGAPRRVGDQHLVTVSVENRGDATALAVQVLLTLTIGEDELEADQVVEHLAGGADEDLEFVLPVDPAGGELDARVSGFQHP